MDEHTAISAVIAGQRRIEAELGEMRQAIVQLARVEERMLGLVSSVQRVEDDLESAVSDRDAIIEEIERRLDRVEIRIAKWGGAIAVMIPVITVSAPYVIEWIAR